MKPSVAANLSLVMVVAGWLLSAYGVLSQMGDPAPWVSRAEIAALHHTSNTFLFVGICSLLSSVWLSGFAFSFARWRASLALLACLLPAIIFFLYAYTAL